MSRETLPAFNRAKWAQQSFMKSARQAVQIELFEDVDYKPLPTVAARDAWADYSGFRFPDENHSQTQQQQKCVSNTALLSHFETKTRSEGGD